MLKSLSLTWFASPQIKARYWKQNIHLEKEECMKDNPRNFQVKNHIYIYSNGKVIHWAFIDEMSVFKAWIQGFKHALNRLIYFFMQPWQIIMYSNRDKRKRTHIRIFFWRIYRTCVHLKSILMCRILNQYIQIANRRHICQRKSAENKIINSISHYTEQKTWSKSSKTLMWDTQTIMITCV